MAGRAAPSSGMRALAEMLADELAARGIDAPHRICMDVIRERATRVGSQLGIQRQSALRYIDRDALANLADSITMGVVFRDVAEELADPSVNPLNMHAALNALMLAHPTHGDTAYEAPLLCVSPLGLLAPQMLVGLLSATTVTAALQGCDAEHDGPCDDRPTPHPHVGVHFNAGVTYGHDNCMVLGMCAGCEARTLKEVLTAGLAVLQAHVRTGGGRTPRVPVHLANPSEARETFDVARARLRR